MFMDFGLMSVLLVALPPLVASGVIALPVLVLIIGFLICIFLSRVLVGWFSYRTDTLREGESETIEMPSSSSLGVGKSATVHGMEKGETTKYTKREAQ